MTDQNKSPPAAWCTNCQTAFEHEEDLVALTDDNGGFVGCSKCNTDAFLMDTSDESPDDPRWGATPEHTPVPWMIEPINDGRTFQITCSTEGIYRIAETETGAPKDKANAEFIVRACNSHYELLAALDDAIDQFEQMERVLTDDVEFTAALAQARAAIAKARRQP